jgi:hypothetical protein
VLGAGTAYPLQAGYLPSTTLINIIEVQALTEWKRQLVQILFTSSPPGRDRQREANSQESSFPLFVRQYVNFHHRSVDLFCLPLILWGNYQEAVFLWIPMLGAFEGRLDFPLSGVKE